MRGRSVRAAIVFVVGTLPHPAFAQSIEWIRQFGAEPRDSALAIDADGNAYLAGATFGTFPSEVAFGAADAFVRKFDATGAVVWTRQFGTSGFDTAFGIATAPGRVYVVGATTGTFPGEVSAGQGDAFVRAYDIDGTHLWTRQFGSASGDIAFSVASDSTGVYLAGATRGALPGQTASGGFFDAFVRKYDAAGNVIWTRQYGAIFTPPSPVTVAVGIAAPDDGGVYVVGRTDGTLDGLGDFDAQVWKFNAANGTGLWIRHFGDPGVNEECVSVTADATGVYVAGNTEGTLPGQVSSGGIDAFARKYDTAGTEMWTSQFGSLQNDGAVGISIEGALVHVAGITSGVFPGEVGAGGVDGFIREIAATDGSELWTTQFGTAFADSVEACATDPTGAYAAGSIGADAFVRKFDFTGAEVWALQFGASGVPGSLDAAFDVAAFGDAAYVVGATAGDLPGPNFGGTDAFVRKYDSAGTVVWARQFGTSGEDLALGVAAVPAGVFVVGRAPFGDSDFASFVIRFDHDGNLVWLQQIASPFGVQGAIAVAVRTESSLPGEQLAIYVAGIIDFTGFDRDGLVMKLDGNGTNLWTVQIDSVGDEPNVDDTNDTVLDIAVESDPGGVYVVGGTTGTLEGERAGGLDAFIVKLAADGFEQWRDQFGSFHQDEAESVAVHEGAVFVSGLAGALPGQTTADEQDAFARRYGSDGNVLWTRQFGTVGFERAGALSADATGIYMTGLVGGTLPNETSAGNFDAFVARMDLFGNFLESLQFGTSSSDHGRGIAVIPGYTTYVAGETSGVFPPNPDVPVGTDAFLAKVLFPPTPIPSEQIAAILAFFDESVANGTLVGSGAGQSRDNRRDTLRKMIARAGRTFEKGATAGACSQTRGAFLRTDGLHPPPDFVEGDTAPELAARLAALLDSVEACSSADADTSVTDETNGQSCALSRHDERGMPSLLLFLVTAFGALIIRRRV